MSQKTIRILKDEIYSKRPKQNNITNKTDIYHFDDIWSLDVLDLKDYGPEKNRGYRYVLIVIDNFSKIVWTVPLKNKNATTIIDFSEIVLLVRFLPKYFIIPSETFLKRLFWNEVILFGLLIYPQRRNNITIEYILLLN